MGTWEELDTEINTTVDTADIDDIIGRLEAETGLIGEAFEPAVSLLSGLKKDVETGSEKGTEELADRARSLQELYIAMNGSIAKGQLINSIDKTYVGENHYLVGTIIEHFYPLCIEKGRGAVRPVRAKALHYFTLDGVEVFSQYSSPTEPKPYVEPAYENVLNEVEDTIWRAIADATNG